MFDVVGVCKMYASWILYCILSCCEINSITFFYFPSASYNARARASCPQSWSKELWIVRCISNEAQTCLTAWLFLVHLRQYQCLRTVFNLSYLYTLYIIQQRWFEEPVHYSTSSISALYTRRNRQIYSLILYFAGRPRYCNSVSESRFRFEKILFQARARDHREIASQAWHLETNAPLVRIGIDLLRLWPASGCGHAYLIAIGWTNAQFVDFTHKSLIRHIQILNMSRSPRGAL